MAGRLYPIVHVPVAGGGVGRDGARHRRRAVERARRPLHHHHTRAPAGCQRTPSTAPPSRPLHQQVIQYINLFPVLSKNISYSLFINTLKMYYIYIF